MESEGHFETQGRLNWEKDFPWAKSAGYFGLGALSFMGNLSEWFQDGPREDLHQDGSVWDRKRKPMLSVTANRLVESSEKAHNRFQPWLVHIFEIDELWNYPGIRELVAKQLSNLIEESRSDNMPEIKEEILSICFDQAHADTDEAIHELVMNTREEFKLNEILQLESLEQTIVRLFTQFLQEEDRIAETRPKRGWPRLEDYPIAEERRFLKPRGTWIVLDAASKIPNVFRNPAMRREILSRSSILANHLRKSVSSDDARLRALNDPLYMLYLIDRTGLRKEPSLQSAVGHVLGSNTALSKKWIELKEAVAYASRNRPNPLETRLLISSKSYKELSVLERVGYIRQNYAWGFEDIRSLPDKPEPGLLTLVSSSKTFAIDISNAIEIEEASHGISLDEILGLFLFTRERCIYRGKDGRLYRHPDCPPEIQEEIWYKADNILNGFVILATDRLAASYMRDVLWLQDPKGGEAKVAIAPRRMRRP